MELLKERIRRDGKIAEGDVLMVGSFLNHQMDIPLICEIGKEFERRYRGSGVTKILTIEASGIGIACIAAQYFGCSVVFAKKKKSSNINDNVYSAPVVSYTKKTETEAMVSKELISKDDKVLILDDFLATGSALVALIDIVKQAGATLVGCGTVIEKAYQNGGKLLRDRGIRVESLAMIGSMSVENGVEFL